MGREDLGSGTDEWKQGRGRGRERPYLGRGLFAGGVCLLLVAVVLAASASIVGALGLGTVEARELAGGLAGIGLAAALVGALAAVPVDRGIWYRGLGGALIAGVGVVGFLWAYPGRWYGDSPDLAFSMLAVYALGIVTAASYLFAGVSDLTERVDRTEALVAAVRGTDGLGTDGSTDTAGNGTDEADRTTDTDGLRADRNGSEVLYERTDGEKEGTAGTTNGTNAANGTNTTESDGTTTIDRIGPTDGGFTWSDSAFAIDPVDRVESGERAPTSGAEAEGTRVALASNGAGTLTASAVDADSSVDRPTGSAGTEPGARETGPATDPTDGGSATPATSGTETGTNSPTGREGRPTAEESENGIDAVRFGPSVDRYCGNCARFQYARTDEELSPYCGYHEELMDDMEPCPGWQSNS
jgi:hypothetical protein